MNFVRSHQEIVTRRTLQDLASCMPVRADLVVVGMIDLRRVEITGEDHWAGKLLEPMSEIAGRMSVVMGASLLDV